MAGDVKKVQGLKLKAGATLQVGERIEAYYNIQLGGFSIVALDKRNPKKGLVIAHTDYVTLQDATFHINEAKLQRIIQTNRKTVYAVIRGIYTGSEFMLVQGHRKGYCNPFRTGAFIDYEDGSELTVASEVYCYHKFFSYKG